MTLITNKKQIKSFLDKLKKCEPAEEMFHITPENFEDKRKYFEYMKIRSISIQKCLLCDNKFVMGDNILNLYCKKSKNKIHVGNLFGKVKYITIAPIIMKIQQIPPLTMINNILIEYDGEPYDILKGDTKLKPDVYRSKIFLKNDY